jgi:hypothetical protein
MQGDCPQETHICIAFSPFVLDYKTTAIVKVMFTINKKESKQKNLQDLL